MTIILRDKATDQMVRRLAEKRRVGLTEAVRLAVGAELERIERETPLRDRIAVLRRSVVARARTGDLADKAFFDDLSGDL